MSNVTNVVSVEEVNSPITKTGRSLRVNYILELQSAIRNRILEYDSSITSPTDLNAMYIHVRAIVSMFLKRETGSPIKRGNNVLSKEEYDKCILYLDKLLPPIGKINE